MKVWEKLAAVQQELKAPKDKMNTYGGYNYRSAEGILEAVKPVLKKYGAVIILTDEIETVGNRVYVKAEAQFRDITGDGVAVCCAARAREAESKKGMDDSQITGTASSYARKYALNGLLLIDDTKDADTDEYQKETHQSGVPAQKVTAKTTTEPPRATQSETAAAQKTYEVADIRMLPDAIITNEIADRIRQMAGEARVNLGVVMTKPLEQLTNKQAGALMTSLQRKIGA